jgi:hypothetical protein
LVGGDDLGRERGKVKGEVVELGDAFCWAGDGEVNGKSEYKAHISRDAEVKGKEAT